MDYNNNDYEGHNLHLTGEESSKFSSVLLPFALPKFDFDDSLNGHLRFDSLVENEVFLGIPSQEDSQWIEDFSRGDSRIAFSSSAAESCALPRHINVWSEATSSESVEMLLKAVGQEEMVSGEKLTEESELGDQLGRSPRQMENNVRQDSKIDDGVDYGNSSLPPAEVEGNICWSNQSAGGEVIQGEYAVQAGETNVPIYGVCADGGDGSLIENSENPDVELKRIIDNKEETCGLVNESLSIHVQENMDVLCPEIGIEKTESPSQNVVLIVKESLVQDKISETSSATPSFVIEAISLSVVEQEEGCKKILGGNAIKTDDTERHCSHKIPSEMESSEDEHSVEICFGNLAEASSVSRIGVSVSTRDGGHMDTFVVEPSGDSQPMTEVFSSGTESNQLTEGHSILHENSFVSLKGEGVVGLEEDSDITELKQVHVGQPSHQNKSPVCREDFHPERHDSFDSPHASFEVQCNPTDKVCKTIHADDPETTARSTFDGEPCGEKSVIDGITDAGYLPTLQKENVEDGNHVALPLVAGNTHKSIVDVIPIQLDACEDDLNVTVHERYDNKLPSDLSDLVCDDNENELSTYSCVGVQVATTTGSQSNSVARDYLLLNTEVEDIKLNVEGDELVEGNEHNTPSCDMAFRDQSEETESQDPKQLLFSVSKEHLELKELTPLETEKGTRPDFEAGKTETSSQSVVLVESSVTAMPDEGHEGLCGKMDSPSIDLIVQDGVEAKYTVKPMEPKLGIKSGSNPSGMSVTICAVEMDKSNQDSPHDINRDLPQHVIDNQASFQRDHVENSAEVLITSMASGVNASSREAEFFTFETRHLGGHSMGDSGKGPFSFPRVHACKLSLTGEGSPSTSGSSQTNPVEVKGVSHVFPTLTSPSGCARGSSARKVRRSGSKPAKASASEGEPVKETTRLKQSEKWEKPSQSLSPSVAGELVTFESIAKPRESVSIPTSSLPDLNTSATSSVLFPQPFTDLQQVQLRAQIFVYGSLIQGTVPDEACMVSAFDGGRSFWAPSWRACMDRLHGQESQGTNTETPISIRSGTKSPVQSKRQGYPQSEAFTGVANRASNKPIPSPIVNPMIALSSPLWNTSFPSTEALPPSSMGRNVVIDYQSVSSLNPFQTPAIRNYVPHTTWSSQVPFPVPWLNPSQSSAYDISTSPAFPVLVEPLKLIPSKESSLAVPSSTKHGSPIPTSHILTSTTFAGSSSLDLKKLNVSTGQTADTKTRKRKKSSGAEHAVHVSMTTALLDTVSDPVVASQLCNKSPAIENLSQISFRARNKGDQLPTPVVSSHYSTLVSVATPSSFVQKSAANEFFSTVSPSIISEQFKRDDLSFDKRALNIECFSKIEEAKFQAQEAAAYAASAISQCEDVWSQLGQQKSSGLSLDAQSKLSSSAVAIAAAASVAKAAAMAAKIASVAALHAKQMAEEAVTKSETVDPTGHDRILVSNSMSLVNASPVSNLQGRDQNNASSLAISTAREASKKRIEAASAATRHAETLDAIVKAAGLAAEAVSHAGKIVAMGEPFSLSELAEARPNSYWKVLKVGDNKNKDKYISNSGVVHEGHITQHKIPDKDMYITSDVVSPIKELSRNMVDDHVIKDSIIAFGKRGENFEPQKDTNVSDSANTAVSDPDIESRSTAYTLSSIKEGSYVEVLKDRGDLKNAWFSANVLRLKDGEALVSYTELQSDEGSEQLKEWISIEAKDSDTPKLRIPHQMTALQIEGTRKRLRSPIKDYTWSVGDKVDAWVQDCWLEGIIAETNKNEVTTLSVHFPVQGETLQVKAWHLRPTLIWSEGQWIEWCRPGQDSASKGDTPVGKRPKLNGSGSIEAKGKAKVANNMDCAEIGRNEIPILPVSANEKTFSTREENKPNIVRTTSSGVEKECSRVVFGVPKPGKKRKFMEVSKHYVSDRVPTNDSVKPAKLLVPQGSGSRGFKSKSKEFQVVGSRSRAIKSVKPTSIPSRILARKDDSTSSRRNTAISDTGKGSISNDENESGEHNLSGFGSFTNVEEATSGGSKIFSSEALPLDNRKKTTARRNIKSGRLNQGKLVPSSGKSEKYEANEKLISESSEPRRSNRRIQPTSRLLEGLQSSLLISKFPSTSHGKKSQDLQQRRNPRE